MRGIAIDGAAQIVFVDTPGIFKPKRRLDRAMVTTAWGGAEDADVVVLLIDARSGHRRGEPRRSSSSLPELRQPKILILNKIDRDQAANAAGAGAPSSTSASPSTRTFMVSALTGAGVDDLLD